MIRETDSLIAPACLRKRASISFPTRRNPFLKVARIAGPSLSSPPTLRSLAQRLDRQRIRVSTTKAAYISWRTPRYDRAWKSPITSLPNLVQFLHASLTVIKVAERLDSIAVAVQKQGGEAVFGVTDAVPDQADTEEPLTMTIRRNGEAEYEQHDQRAAEDASAFALFGILALRNGRGGRDKCLPVAAICRRVRRRPEKVVDLKSTIRWPMMGIP